MQIIYSPRCLEYGDPGHPESPERIRGAANYLWRKGYFFLEPEPCSEQDLLRVHSSDLVEGVKAENFSFVGDTPRIKDIYHYARLAAGGAILACEMGGFSLLRPPGHHAGRDFLGGFCYFNNLAIAVEKSGKDTLIVDIDGHHGNGTQDIFRASRKVSYISMHRMGYPGTGLTSGRNYSNNMFRWKMGDSAYVENLRAMLQSAPQTEQIAVSAGFDAYDADPFASLGLTRRGFFRLGQVLAGQNTPLFCVLEGGYVANQLGPLVHNFLAGLSPP